MSDRIKVNEAVKRIDEHIETAREMYSQGRVTESVNELKKAKEVARKTGLIDTESALKDGIEYLTKLKGK